MIKAAKSPKTLTVMISEPPALRNRPVSLHSMFSPYTNLPSLMATTSLHPITLFGTY